MNTTDPKKLEGFPLLVTNKFSILLKASNKDFDKEQGLREIIKEDFEINLYVIFKSETEATEN